MFLTSSFRSIRPSKGLDIDHWFRQFSKIIVFMMEDSICWSISGWSSSILRKGVEWEGDMGAPFSLLSFLKRNERIWSRVLQHPVQTMGSGEEGDELSHTKDAITSTPSPTHIITITYPPSPILHHSTPSPTHTYHHLPTLTYSHTYPPSPNHPHLPTIIYPPTLTHPHLTTLT